MSKGKKKKRGRQTYKSKNTSGLGSHKMKGSELVPPFLQIPVPQQPMSWKDDRLPEMLWAALLVTTAPREVALAIFREVADFIYSLPEDERFADVTHTGLSALPPERLRDFLTHIIRSDTRARALSPLLVLDDLPAKEIWQERLTGIDDNESWKAIARAVAACLDHQSQESTDCRWLKLLAAIVARKLHLPQQMGEEILHYPDKGDMRAVRPTIRAAEGGLALPDEPDTTWAEAFWAQGYRETYCFELPTLTSSERSDKSTDISTITEVYESLVNHCMSTTSTTTVDAKHDAVFGLALYALAILEELIRPGNRYGVVGRSSLRTLAECYITLAYLLSQDDEKSWKSYRVYGAGQAKLALLKFEESSDAPPSVDMDTLDHLANEDAWQEFVSINLGHWEKMNLRKMSVSAGIIDDYDKYYPWSSQYSHGQWGAVRDTVFATCGNPLHRLHRIPQDNARQLPNVLPDACEIVDKMLVLVDAAYPTFTDRVTLIVQ